MRPLLTINEQMERTVYEWFCIGIVVSLIFFPISVSILGIALFLFWLLMTVPAGRAKSSKPGLVILFSSLYILVLIGISYSQNLPYALFKAQQKSALAVFPLVLGYSRVLNAESVRKIQVSFVVSTLLACLYCLCIGLIHFFRTGEINLLNGHPLVKLKDMNPYLMAFVCVMAIIFCFEEYFRRAEIFYFKNVLLLFSVILFSIFIILIGNRTVLVIWLLVSFFYYFRLFTSLWFRIIVPLVVLVLSGIAILFVPALNQQVKELTDNSANTRITLDKDSSLGRSWGGKAIRVAIWQCSMDIIKENPAVGVGSGDAQDALQQAYENRMFYFASRYNRYNAHNQYLQELINSGLIGLVIWLFCLAIPMIMAWRNADHIYFIFLLGIAAIALTESVLEISKGLVLYSFFNSFFAFAQKKKTVL
jgi:O-antigen ligase